MEHKHKWKEFGPIYRTIPGLFFDDESLVGVTYICEECLESKQVWL